MNKTYALLVLHQALDKAGSFVYDFFLGSILFVSGWSLPNIILFFLIEFGLRGSFHFVSPLIARTIGIRLSIVLSYLSLSVFFVLLALVREPAILFPCIIFHSFGRGLYYPVSIFLKSFCIADTYRGRFYMGEMISGSVLTIAATWIGSRLLDINIAFPVLISIACFGIGFLVIQNTAKHIEGDFLQIPLGTHPIQDMRSTIFSDDVRRLMPILFTKTTSVILQVIFVPLLLFSATGSFSLTGNVFVLSLSLEFLFLIAAGYTMDTRQRRNLGVMTSIALVFVLGALGMNNHLVTLGFSAIAALVILFRLMTYGYRGVIEVTIQDSVRNSTNPLFFAAAQEGLLCWSEVALLSLLFLTTYIDAGATFAVAILIGVVGILAFVTENSRRRSKKS